MILVLPGLLANPLMLLLLLLAEPTAIEAAGTATTASVLAFGLIFGLQHAIEADHVAAVSTIVSERKSLLSSSLVGGLWGIGHTISLFIAGIIVLFLRVQISERTEQALEFCVGLMLVGLGVNALRKLVSSGGGKIHIHTHTHGERTHIHPHIHDTQHDSAHDKQEAEAGSPAPPHHHRVGTRPLVVGMIHGLAGSAALMLLVLSTIESPMVGLLYIAIFGLGSIGGMMLMSALVGLPMWLTAGRYTRLNVCLRGLAGLFSVSFGLFMIYEIGIAGNLFR